MFAIGSIFKSYYPCLELIVVKSAQADIIKLHVGTFTRSTIQGLFVSFILSDEISRAEEMKYLVSQAPAVNSRSEL